MLLILTTALTLPVAAKDSPSGETSAPSTDAYDPTAVTTPEAYQALPDALPDELSDLLPDGLFSSDLTEAASAAEELSGLGALCRVLLDAVGLKLPDAVRLLATLTGLLILSALLGKLREGFHAGSGQAFAFCLRLALFAAIVSLTVGLTRTVTTYLDRLCALCGGMLPVMGTLYALGGDLGRAAVSESVLLAFLAAVQYISASVTPPVCGICLGLSLIEAIGTRLRLSPIADMVKRGYAWLIGVITFLLSTVLGLQTALTAGADSLRMKGVKYAVGSMLPMVGGAVSGSLGTVAAGIATLRGVCGVSGIILLALLLLPTLVELLLFRWMISLAATAATLLGCDGEAKLLGEIAGLYGYMAAAVSLCSVLFVIALAIFTKSAVALV